VALADVNEYIKNDDLHYAELERDISYLKEKFNNDESKFTTKVKCDEKNIN
jgi:uncharacterized protein (DUF2132 family)